MQERDRIAARAPVDINGTRYTSAHSMSPKHGISMGCTPLAGPSQAPWQSTAPYNR